MEEVNIADLAVAVAAQYGREINVKPGRLPEGSPPRRLPEISRLRSLGYEPKVSLAQGLAPTIDWYKTCGR
jgi:nucleoside-diphosphate-sugar epimerase